MDRRSSRFPGRSAPRCAPRCSDQAAPPQRADHLVGDLLDGALDAARILGLDVGCPEHLLAPGGEVAKLHLEVVVGADITGAVDAAIGHVVVPVESAVTIGVGKPGEAAGHVLVVLHHPLELGDEHTVGTGLLQQFAHLLFLVEIGGVGRQLVAGDDVDTLLLRRGHEVVLEVGAGHRVLDQGEQQDLFRPGLIDVLGPPLVADLGGGTARQHQCYDDQKGGGEQAVRVRHLIVFPGKLVPDDTEWPVLNQPAAGPLQEDVI